MKKIATLLLAAGLVFGAATGSSAIEFNAKGQWIMSFDLGNGGLGYSGAGNGVGGKNKVSGYNNGSDNFNVQQRVRLQLEAVASEALSGTINFEMGNQTWGNNVQGGALGTDGVAVAVKHAYLDWIVPNTALKVRMGLQNIALPSFSLGQSQVFDTDVAAIAASYQFNDSVGATFVWARPLNDNFSGIDDDTRFAAGGTVNTASANVFDNIDIFALIVPMSFNNVKIAPWAAYAMIGKNSLAPEAGTAAFGYSGLVMGGMLPEVLYRNLMNGSGTSPRTAYGDAFWVGLTGEVAAGNGLRFAWDANYGSSIPGKMADKREGWYLDALVEYKMAWGTPGLYAWYGSGDDGNIKNGSERMPSFAADGDDSRSNLAGNGTPYIGRESVLNTDWTGTMGLGLRLKDMSFMEDLKHTFRVNYMQGTNNTKMAKYLAGTRTTGNGTAMVPLGNTVANTYLTTADSAIEIGLTNTYQIYDNLVMYTELDYLFLNMNNATWKNNGGTGMLTQNANARGVTRTDPWNINVSFVYSF